MKIYFNTNIYCRPFDDLTQKRIFEEARASLNLFLLALSKIIQISSSEMVLAEISLIDSPAKRKAVESLVLDSGNEYISLTSGIKKLATEIGVKCKIDDYADCLHLASACIAQCNYFVTCDDELIAKVSLLESFFKTRNFSLRVRNPLEILDELEVR